MNHFTNRFMPTISSQIVSINETTINDIASGLTAQNISQQDVDIIIQHVKHCFDIAFSQLLRDIDALSPSDQLVIIEQLPELTEQIIRKAMEPFTMNA